MLGRVIVGMTMSLDGFVHDARGNVSDLYPDLKELRNTDLMAQAIRDTGAVVMGRRAFEMGDADL
jgi:hypothetical protein